MYQYFYNFFKKQLAQGVYSKDPDDDGQSNGEQTARITQDADIRVTMDGDIRIIND